VGLRRRVPAAGGQLQVRAAAGYFEEDAVVAVVASESADLRETESVTVERDDVLEAFGVPRHTQMHQRAERYGLRARSLGRVRPFRLAGVDVPRIGMGTNRLSTAPQDVAFVREAVAAGVRHIDTAHLYTGGASERALGEALDGVREDVLVATKGGYRPGEGRPEVLGAQIEESLRSLRTDTITLYYLHRVDPETALEVSLGAIKDARDAGTILHVGVSNVSVAQIERARQVVPIAAVENHYNLSERRHDDVVDYCEREGIVFVAYFPLRDGGPPVLHEIARRHGVTTEQIALAWLLRRSPTLMAIPGTLSLEHLKENLAAMDVELSDAEFDALSAG
jgi:pyridoxine 4-dehydrogenase